MKYIFRLYGGPLWMVLLIGLFEISVAHAEVLTLDQARAQALAHRAEVDLQTARKDKAAAQIRQIDAGQRPRLAGQLEASASPGAELVPFTNAAGEEFLVSGTRPLEDGADSFLPVPRYGATVGLEWNLYDFGRTASAKQAAQAEARALDADADALKARIQSEVDQAYLAWLGADAQYQLRAEGLRELETKKTELTARIEAGTLSRSALFPLETDLAQAELDRATADWTRQRARLALGQAMGAPVSKRAEPERALLDRKAPKISPPEESSASTALAARQTAVEATRDMHANRYAPQLSLSGFVGLRGQEDRLFPAYLGLLRLKIPLWDGGQGQAKADAAQAEVRMLEARRAQIDTAQAHRVQQAQLELAQTETRVTLAEKLVAVTVARLKDTEERFSDGGASADEVSQARKARHQAEGTWVAAKIDRVRVILSMR